MQPKLKICGMRDPENIREIGDLYPEYMGFIFYPGSSRYVGDHPDLNLFNAIPSATRRVGVFVNEMENQVVELMNKYHLTIAQLHGQETPEYCSYLQKQNILVMKAFALSDQFDFDQLENYKSVVDYFLFDTKGKNPGGNGIKFNWSALDHYSLKIPFFLSGGIGPEDAEIIGHLQYPQLYAVDLNSGFETAPAMKSSSKLKRFIKELGKYSNTCVK